MLINAWCIFSRFSILYHKIYWKNHPVLKKFLAKLDFKKKLEILSVISLCLPYKEDPHWFSGTGCSTVGGDRWLQEYVV